MLCRHQHGDVIPAQELMKRIASSPQHEIHCSGGPVQINQQHYQGDVSLLKGQGDWLPVVSLDLETYVASVVGAEMPSSGMGKPSRRKPLQPAPMRWPISPDRQRWRITWGIHPLAGICRGAKHHPGQSFSNTGNPRDHPELQRRHCGRPLCVKCAGEC